MKTSAAEAQMRKCQPILVAQPENGALCLLLRAKLSDVKLRCGHCLELGKLIKTVLRMKLRPSGNDG